MPDTTVAKADVSYAIGPMIVSAAFSVVLAPLLLALLLALLPGAGTLTIDSIGIAKILLFSQHTPRSCARLLIAGSVRGDLFDAERATSS